MGLTVSEGKLITTVLGSMGIGRHRAGAADDSERKTLEMAQPPSSDTPLPTGPHLLILPKYFHQVGAKYSNIEAYGHRSHSKYVAVN